MNHNQFDPTYYRNCRDCNQNKPPSCLICHRRCSQCISCFEQDLYTDFWCIPYVCDIHWNPQSRYPHPLIPNDIHIYSMPPLTICPTARTLLTLFWCKKLHLKPLDTQYPEKVWIGWDRKHDLRSIKRLGGMRYGQCLDWKKDIFEGDPA